ncbi:MAG: ElyC/SanA/YdcF family protein [Natronospirillum sp.]
MYDLLKVLVAHLLAPLPLMAGLFLLGVVVSLLGHRKLGKGLSVTAALMLVLFSWAPVADRLVFNLEGQYPSIDAWPEADDIQAVVVLGSGWDPDQPWSAVSRLESSSALRLMEGIRLWRQQPETTLIVTGADRREHVRPIAEGYHQAALALGVPSERLLALDWPTDTGQEARAVQSVLDDGARVLLVTSASHMPRSMIHFQQAGLSPMAAPTDYLAHRNQIGTLGYWVPSARHLRKTERAFYEGLGMIATRWE